MNRICRVCVGVLLVTTALLVSCSTQQELVGLWQSTEDGGAIEFTAAGAVVVTDNMSATVSGRYEVEEDGSLRLELTDSDILRDSVGPMAESVLEARFELAGDELTLHFDDGESASYRRVR